MSTKTKRPRPAPRMARPSERCIGRELQRLRTQIETSKDPIVTRISYAMECAIRWARENTVGWPLPAENAVADANMLHEELSTAELAHAAYRKASIALHGEFAPV